MSVEVNHPPSKVESPPDINVAGAEKNLMHASIQLFLGHEQNSPGGHTFSYVSSATMTAVDPSVYIPDPFYFHLRGNAAQKLMDDLWSAGIRPSFDTTEDVSNLKAHIEDLRRIVWHFLNPEN